MSIEQTNQLILLILNSVLMTLLASMVLGGAWLRQNALLQQLHKTKSLHRKLARLSSLNSDTEQSVDITTSPQLAIHTSGLKQVRDSRQQIKEQYRWSRISVLILHTTLLIFSVSLFALALRSLLAFDSLISMALFLFTVGAAGLIVGCGCILVDLAKGESHDASHNDSLGDAIAKRLQPIAHQWTRTSRKLSRPIARPTRPATQNRPVTPSRPVTIKAPSPPTRDSERLPGTTTSQQVSN